MRLADLDPQQFVEWFRHAAPYINAHRGRTFVVAFPGAAVEGPRIDGLVHDLAVLASLGVRLVLVPGARPQVEQRLRRRGLEPRYAQGSTGLRITDGDALECVRDAIGEVRTRLEARLSTGVATSPMAGLRLRVASGNVITARPVGVRDGIDHLYTGEVRRVDAEALRRRLDDGDVALVSPLGYSPTGEAFNLSAESVARAVGEALAADKLIHLTRHAPLRDADGAPVRELTPREARARLDAGGLADDARRLLHSAHQACLGGVGRVHLLDRTQDGALLLELFTRDGVGTLIAPEPFESLRTAGLDDIPGILGLIRPLEESGALVYRPQELLEEQISAFTVAERDGAVVATGALLPWPAEDAGEIACLAVDPDYRGAGRADALVRRLEQQARGHGLHRLFVLTTRAEHWFRERGFEPAAPEALPATRRALYDRTRGSKVLVRDIP
ncbi:amino-acid N-acetyltransferase [Halorhodospira sp. 9621]|uniref:amino-acid N-acetyltransferase n=1 Tax=Halorhodospira TaxID=85108 RepID=UPI001EE973D9|nr:MULTISPECIES: amino-acid N-acetyltransferase [Halorhodospira]MCG5527522.1 amino-acid N-acetyltransferase [Halorhodospira halophila]MCG5533521.1 amino-acid N-acetyltransferase [Halorhodospira sp. 9621]MCG5544348.1 amino-acid N-acetyltransferase [Halorhodospira sp. 9628]